MNVPRKHKTLIKPTKSTALSLQPTLTPFYLEISLKYDKNITISGLVCEFIHNHMLETSLIMSPPL